MSSRALPLISESVAIGFIDKKNSRITLTDFLDFWPMACLDSGSHHRMGERLRGLKGKTMLSEPRPLEELNTVPASQAVTFEAVFAVHVLRHTLTGDVSIHASFTSTWDGYKYRQLSDAPKSRAEAIARDSGYWLELHIAD